MDWIHESSFVLLLQQLRSFLPAVLAASLPMLFTGLLVKLMDPTFQAKLNY